MTETSTLDLEAHMRDVTERAVRNAFAVYMRSHEPPVKGIVADLTDIAADSAARAIYAAMSDRGNGTPCAEIRWQEERESLAKERDELRKELQARTEERDSAQAAADLHARQLLVAEFVATSWMKSATRANANTRNYDANGSLEQPKEPA